VGTDQHDNIPSNIIPVEVAFGDVRVGGKRYRIRQNFIINSNIASMWTTINILSNDVIIRQHILDDHPIPRVEQHLFII
jgi:hypothetical protein